VIATKLLALAGVAKLADAPDLGSGAERRGGSSPFTRTSKKPEASPRVFSHSEPLALLDLDLVLGVVNLKAVRAAVNNLGALVALAGETKLFRDVFEELLLATNR
jgi:hypothetical protein